MRSECFPDDPGEIVHALEDLVVDLERAAGRVAEAGQIVAERDVRNAPGILVGDLDRHADLGIHILDARQLLA